MFKLFILSIVLLLSNLLFLWLRFKFRYKNDSVPLSIFLGNYIFFSHYFFITVSILYIVNSFIHKFSPVTLTAAILLFLIFIGILGYINFSKTNVVETDIQVSKKTNIDKLRVAFISDIHLSGISNFKILNRAIEKINLFNPDVVLVGGDIIDYNYKEIKDDYPSIFKKIKSKYGVYAILGNHDCYGNIKENIKYIESLGMTLLIDQAISINGVNIIGRNDQTYKKRAKLKNIIKINNIDKSSPIIVLDHSPKHIKETEKTDTDILLSGHTHNGQFFPYNLIVNRMFKNALGYKKIGNLHTIVSSGLGSWLIPYRINSNSEIYIIDINFNS